MVCGWVVGWVGAWVGGWLVEWVGGSSHQRCDNIGTADTEYMKTLQKMKHGEIICENLKTCEKKERRADTHTAHRKQTIQKMLTSSVFSQRFLFPSLGQVQWPIGAEEVALGGASQYF